MSAARIKVSPELVAGLLFDGADCEIRILDANMRPMDGFITLYIMGDCVPDAPDVIAEISEARRTIKFKPV